MRDLLVIDMDLREIRADVWGFEGLAQLHSKLAQFKDQKIAIDCRKLGWLDAQLGVCLLTIVDHSRLRGNSVQLLNLAPRIREILQKNMTVDGARVDTHGTTIPVTRFLRDEEVKFSHFTRSRLQRREMPRMSEGLLSKFFEGIDELFANSALWSNSATPFISGGQYFPRLDRLSFIISDGGRGIEGSLAASGKRFGSPEDAIDWAMEMNNSARQGDIPGGLGLWILKEFIKMNEGCLLVCSHSGYWECRAGVVSKRKIKGLYPGTAVSLEINTSDTKSYHMQSSINPHEIW